MQRPGWTKLWLPPRADGQPPAQQRDRLALAVAALTFACVCTAFLASKDTQFLMPGPLTSSHGGIESCKTCHSNSGSGKLSFVRGLAAGDTHGDSKACLTCHKMPDTAFNAHGATPETLKSSTERLQKFASEFPAPMSARAQAHAVPTGAMSARGLECATCHQEHQGGVNKLAKISNEQCRSCHVAKFDSFDGDHPKFDENFPFKRRTRIVYDHASHFAKHYPEVAKKDPSKRIPATCSTCHNASDDKRMMGVAPFDQTCAACHLDQIKGKERVSGPKGIAFLTLPGLDLQALTKKNAAIGEWPDASDAALSPFMKVMIGRTEPGRVLLKAIDGLNLQDLGNANDDQLKSVVNLVWEIKALFHTMIAGKPSDTLGDLTLDGKSKLSATFLTDLTASIPRDVVISAQQQWLPNLAKEITNRSGGNQSQSNWSAVVTGASGDAKQAVESKQVERSGATEDETTSSDEQSATDAFKAAPGATTESVSGENAAPPQRATQACLVRVLGQCMLSKDQPVNGESNDAPSTARPPGEMRAGLADAAKFAEATPGTQRSEKPADQSDDLLFPTEEELREIKARTKGDARAAKPNETTGQPAPASGSPVVTGDAATNSASPPPVPAVESGIDAENWAEYGGWYRQDFGIFYRPTGHKDRFVTAWLTLTGPQGSKGDASPAASVFDALTHKDAQGSCSKCHSIDDGSGKGRTFNFAPATVASKKGQFTSFLHEPHFAIMDTRSDSRGCLSCHNLEKGRPYLPSYEQTNPQSFASNFGAVKKDLCQSCHTSGRARQDCQTCHTYHVNGVVTRDMDTKIPLQ